MIVEYLVNTERERNFVSTPLFSLFRPPASLPSRTRRPFNACSARWRTFSRPDSYTPSITVFARGPPNTHPKPHPQFGFLQFLVGFSVNDTIERTMAIASCANGANTLAMETKCRILGLPYI